MAQSPGSITSTSDLRVGFVPLLDAAPLIAARELGYFSDEGLRVTLERQIGWGNVRDKLVYAHLHASHALVGMPSMSILGRDRFPEPLTAIMSLGTGGNAITLSRKLTDVGIDSAAELARHARMRNPATPALLAHVFGCSMHHYLLRDWLAAGGVDPDRDVQLCVLPPPQMTRQMSLGTLDGFCSGEPWNTQAEQEGLGKIVAVTTDLFPDHPEKVLAVSHKWLRNNAAAVEALIRATLRGCLYCSDPTHVNALAQMLSPTCYLDLPVERVLRSLTIDKWYGGPSRRGFGPIRGCSMAATFPAATHAAWLLKQMVRWKHLPAETDVFSIAGQAVESAPYRRAAASMNLECPPDDWPRMRLRSGWFDAKLCAVTAPPGTRPIPAAGYRALTGLAPVKQGV